MPKTITKKPISTKPGSMNGLRDIYTQTSPHWHAILRRLRKTGKSYGFLPVETPIVEEEKIYTDLFRDQPQVLERTIFTHLGNKSVALRSSVLPSVLRYYVQQKLFDEQPMSKWFYAGNIIEQDERQAAHLNYQFGFEVLGNFNHLSEAQVICAVWEFLKAVGLSELQLEINMVGDGSNTGYQSVLKDYLKTKDFDLCENCVNDCNGRVFNVLRCNNLGCQLVVAEAPSVLDYLDEESKAHFTNVLEALDELSIPYQLNQYYAGPAGTSRTNFMIKYIGDKEQVVLGEGGHHELLLKNITGKALPAFGFVGNLAAIAKARELSGVELEPDYSNEVFLVPLGELAAKKSLRLFRDLILSDIKVHDHFGSEGVKNQLKAAQEFKAPVALIMGQKEALDEMVILRDVKSGMQEIFPYDKIIEEVKKRLGR
jgi:histidyl-tRNA synthetase